MFGPKLGTLDSPKPRSPFAFRRSVIYEHALTRRDSPVGEKDTPRGVVPYNANLPVQVVEALANTDTAHVSCKLDPSGWAWLVRGRKLYVWKFQQTPIKGLSCTEIGLPSTELYHKADLTCIVQLYTPSSCTPKGSTTVALMNISPEGIVRFWPNLSNPGVFIETSAGLNGKECYSLTPLKPHGCILVTTTNDMLLLTPLQSTVSCRQFHLPVGMLSGFSKKVSKFLLGSSGDEETLHLPRVACCRALSDPDESTKQFYVLAGGSLNKWEIKDGIRSTEKVLFQADILSLLKDELTRVMKVSLADIIQVEPFDISSTGHGVAVVAGVVSSLSHGIKVVLVFGTLECSGAGIAPQFSSLVPLQPEFHFESEDEIPEFKMMIPAGLYRAFIFKSDFVISVPVSESSEEALTIDPPGKDIIGAGFLGPSPIFLSKRNGFFTISVANRDSSLSTSQLNVTRSPFSAASKSEISFDKTEFVKSLKTGMSVDKDELNVLAEGFGEYAEGNVFEAQEMVVELTISYSADKSALKMSKDIIDSIPASDPRWASSEGSAGLLRGMTPSVIITNQLQDKEKYHAMFLKYLQDVDLWDKLSTYDVGGKKYSTKISLLENTEKIRVCIVLQDLYQSHSSLLEKAFAVASDTLQAMQAYSDELTNQDKVFQKVSNVVQLFPAIISVQEDVIKSMPSFKDLAEIVMRVNTLISEPIKEALLVRKSCSGLRNQEFDKDACFFLWTAQGGKDGLRTILRDQAILTAEKILPNADSTRLGSVLAQQVFDLTDLLLDGYQAELETTRDITLEEAYKSDRKRLLTPLVREGYYEISLELAEKYKDFATLIALCDHMNDTERLEHYKTSFADMGFLDQLYQWYIDKGDWYKLLNQEHSTQLDKFLGTHHQLRWLNQIGNKEFDKAAATLLELAKHEKDFLSRKKTMLSLSKLCTLASSQDADIVRTRVEELEKELILIQLQETLPEEIALRAELDPEKMAPLTADRLIELYTGETNPLPDVYDFRRALDLVSYIDQERKSEVQVLIWSRAILHDKCWTEQVTMDPVIAASQTFFGQCVKSFIEQGLGTGGIIPSIDALLSSPVLASVDLVSNNNFLYLIRAFYESNEL